MAGMLFVGGGPKTTGILLALAAQARADRSVLPDELRIDVVDPYPPGGGRIWRHDQSPVLWMNSIAADITVFPDEDATLGPDGQAGAAPITGPSLAEWVPGEGREVLRGLGLEDAADLGPRDFAPRRVQAAYLGWAFERMRQALPEGISLAVHRTRAMELRAVDGAYEARLEDGRVLRAEAAVLAQGFLEINEDTETAQYRELAADQGLVFIAPGYTADLDLDVVPAGSEVLVRGMGLAFVDAMMMLTEGRGGRFRRPAGGSPSETVYEPSGQEPVLWAGSRRGVPYLPKLGYVAEGVGIAPPRYLGTEQFEAMAAASPQGTVDGAGQVLPLLEAEMAAAHYQEVLRHPDRTTAEPEQLLDPLDRWAEALRRQDREAAARARVELEETVAATVPDPRDRFDLRALTRPFDGQSFPDAAGFEQELARHVVDGLDRAKDPRFSQDSAVFFALVSAYYRVREAVARGLFTTEDRVHSIDGVLHGAFSSIASGPPPERLENMLALHRAGILRFLGPGMDVRVEDGRFRATSTVHPETVTAIVFMEARLARISAGRAQDTLLQSLIASGGLVLERGAGQSAKFLTDPRGRALDATGTPHAGLFLVGPSVAGSVEEAFSRPGTDALVFRDNARLARELAARLA